MLTRGGFQCRFSGLKNNGGVVRCGLWQRWVAGLALEHLVALGEGGFAARNGSRRRPMHWKRSRGRQMTKKESPWRLASSA